MRIVGLKLLNRTTAEVRFTYSEPNSHGYGNEHIKREYVKLRGNLWSLVVDRDRHGNIINLYGHNFEDAHIKHIEHLLRKASVPGEAAVMYDARRALLLTDDNNAVFERVIEYNEIGRITIMNYKPQTPFGIITDTISAVNRYPTTDAVLFHNIPTRLVPTIAAMELTAPVGLTDGKSITWL